MCTRLKSVKHRSIISLFAIAALTSLCYVFFSIAVLPRHPSLLPLAILLVFLSLSSACATLLQRPTPIPSPHCSPLQPSSSPFCKDSNPPALGRSRHCFQCGTYTLRFSHHCGILGLCIGAHNYKPFLLLLSYASVSSVLLLALSLPQALSTVVSLYQGTLPFSLSTLFWLQLFYLQIILSVTLSLYLALHLYLVALNHTFREAFSRRSRLRICPPWNPTRSVYDRGFRLNFTEVFGTLPSALLPFISPHVRRSETPLSTFTGNCLTHLTTL